MPNGQTCKIAFVAEELAFGMGAGGIGGAFHELAIALRRAGHAVDLIYLPSEFAVESRDAMVAYYADHGIPVVDPDIARFVWPPFSYERRSYALFRHLVELEEPYDFIHFHDYKGLGFCTLAAKTQHLGFPNTTIIVQAHGPTRWTLEANDHPFTHEDQLKIDFMERESIARADVLVSPSRYMINWFRQNGWAMPPAERVHVIQNVCTHLSGILGPLHARAELAPSNEIIFFGRHEERKGIALFGDALDLVGDRLADANTLVTFLGGFGVINGEASALYLARRSRDWRFPIRLLPDCGRVEASRYIARNDRSVVVVPSRIENSPYTVLEAAIIGKPVVTSDRGGAAELLDPAQAATLTCAMDRDALAAKLVEAIRKGLPTARLAIAAETTERLWIELHSAPAGSVPVGNARKKPAAVARRTPKVVAAITHYERPAKLYDAVMSLVSQLYPQLEIVVVDDGSQDVTSLQLLDRLAPLFAKCKVRLLRQPNRYLGAARNHAIAETDSDYILFLDDDDIAFPNLVQTLVTAAEATGADIVNCLNLYMPEARRAEAHPFPDRFRQKASYVPTGGPLSLAPLDNCYGGATALIRRSAAALIGNYTEDYGVGHEDYEFYVRALQAGLRIEVCPLPLYLYEVDRPSMGNSTSRLRNWSRVARAVDLSKQPLVWRDFVSLCSGRQAQEHVDNYAAYQMRSGPRADLLERIAKQPVNSAAYATLLAEYSAVLGAAAYTNALHSLAAARSSCSGGPAPVLMPALAAWPITASLRRPQIDTLLLGASIDLSLGRVAQATDAFILTWEREPGFLSGGQLRFLRALACHDGLTAADARQVLDPLKRKSFDLDELRALVPVMFGLALRAHDTQAAIGIVGRALIVDEQTYHAADASVAEAISHGACISALDHFVRAGETQNDAGFSLLREIKAALHRQVGIDVPLTSLHQYVQSLAQDGTGQVDAMTGYAVAEASGAEVHGNGTYRRLASRIANGDRRHLAT
jgi:glycosyltransferase involved in cell wall biosynthesis